jgi:hypothetical protein
MFEYRNVLVRMRLGDSNRRIAKAKLMGRRKAEELRQLAQSKGWLNKEHSLPDDAVLAEALKGEAPELPAVATSSVEPFRDQVIAWRTAGIQGTTIHKALVCLSLPLLLPRV